MSLTINNALQNSQMINKNYRKKILERKKKQHYFHIKVKIEELPIEINLKKAYIAKLNM